MIKKIKQMFAIKTNSRKQLMKNLLSNYMKKNTNLFLICKKFNNNCFEINCFLSKYNHFLRVFELKNQFRHFTRKDPKKQNIFSQISSCLIEKYNGFQSISLEFARREIKNFKPIDIIYKPTKNPEISPLCLFTEDILKAYTNFYNIKDKTKRAYNCYECYYCRKLFLKKDRHKRHIGNCTGGCLQF